MRVPTISFQSPYPQIAQILCNLRNLWIAILRGEGHADFVAARGCAEGDVEPVPAVNGYHSQSQIHQLCFAELRARLLVDVVGNVFSIDNTPVLSLSH